MNRISKITATILALLMLSSTMLVSCSSDSDTKKTDGNTTTAPTTTDAPETSAPTSAPSSDDVDLSSVIFPELSGSDLISSDEFVYDDYLKFLEIGDLSGVILYEKDVQKEYDDYVADVLESYKTYTEAPEGTAAQNGDRVTIFYTGKSAEGETFSDSTMSGMTNEGSETGAGLVLGSNSFVGYYTSESDPSKNARGFEEQLIGAKAGDTVTVTVRFSDIYDLAELRGKLVDFTVRVTKVECADDPTLTDDIVKDYTGGEYDNIDAFKDYLIGQYKGQMAYEAVSALIKIISYPESDINDQIEEYKKSYLEYFDKKESDLSEDEKKELDDDARENAESYVGQRIIWNYLFGVYDITLTKYEYISMIRENYEQYSTYYYYYYGVSDVSEFIDYFGASNLISQFKQQKLVGVLAEKVTWSSKSSEN